MSKLGRGRTMTGLVVVAATALLLSCSAHLFLFNQWRAPHEQQVHRARIQEEVLRLHRLVMEIETNFRGYLLTSQPSFLELIHQSDERLTAGLLRLQGATRGVAGLEGQVGLLSARLREFSESKQRLLEAVESDRHDQVLRYVRGGAGRALFLTVEGALDDFEMRLENELPAEPITYASWIQQAGWQLLIVQVSGIMLCLYLAQPRRVSDHASLQSGAGA